MLRGSLMTNSASRKVSPCIAAAMRAASRRLTMLYDEAMAPSGLRVTQYTILSQLERQRSDPPTVSELAEILTMERSSLGQTLGPLERDGFLELIQDARDKRRRLIRLTVAGDEALERARPFWLEAHCLFEDAFGQDALVELRSTLRGIVEAGDFQKIRHPDGPRTKP